jgi:FkbM family methyltransferase
VALLPELATRDAAAIDVGAHFGLYARPLSRLVRQVHAFEPLPEFAALLRRTSATNVVVHEIALAAAAGEAELRIPNLGGRPAHGLATLRPGGEGLRLTVTTARLDEVVTERVGFIKIDVEGAELEVLEGAAGILTRDRPAVLVEAEERHLPGATRRIFDHFDALDYRGEFLLDGRRRPVADFDAATMQDPARIADRRAAYVNNFLFLPRS